jgi:type IV secretory pathway TraG/TraD family ATPase VirD4
MTTFPTVVILRCAEEHEKTYGAYLGTILRVLTTRLNGIGQRAGGQLPIPVGLILEEFPALGRLDSLVRDINLFRKRRISVLTAAQSLAQFDSIYPAKGEADQLQAGLATKIVFGGCDQRTADFFSRLSGQQTIALASLSRGQRQTGTTFHNTGSASLRGCPLLLADNIIRPDKGHATFFAAYSGTGRADQAIFHGELTPFFKRRDWKLKRVQPKRPLVVARPSRELDLSPPMEPERRAGDVQPVLDLGL